MPDIRFSEDTTLADGTVIPAGTVVKNAPEGVSRANLIRKLSRNSSSLGVMLRNTAGSMLENAQGLAKQFGHLTVDPLVNPLIRAKNFAQTGDIRQLEADPRFAPVTPENQILPQNRPIQEMGNLNPSLQLPTLDRNDIFAGAQLLGEFAARNDRQQMGLPMIPATNFADAQSHQQAISEASQEAYPMASMAGDVLGPAITLGALRGPIAAQRGISQLNHVRNMEEASRLAQRSSHAIANNPNLRSALNEAIKNSTMLKNLGNRVGRAAEAGLEGATLAVLNGGDPVEVAAYSAGGQMAGSLLLGGISVKGGQGMGKAGLTILGKAAGIAALLQLGKQFVIGGDDNPMDSLKSGFNKLLGVLALGAVSGIAGAGRVTNRFPVAALPGIADGITSLQRGATISVLNELLKDPAAEKVVKKMSREPNYFGRGATQRLQQAIESEKVSLTETIEELSRSPDFRELLENL